MERSDGPIHERAASARRVRWAVALLVVATLAFAVPSLARSATFTVNTTADAPDASPGDGVCNAATGGCTLRAALQESDASAGSPDTIAFAIPGGPPFVIEPHSDLPLITDPVVIDGATECIALVLPNCSGPSVEIRSPVAPLGVPTPFFGLALRAGHTTIADLSIVGFFEAVSIQAIPATCDCGHNVLVDDYIGLEPDGNLPAMLGGVARPPSSGWGNTAVEIDSGDVTCVDCLSGNRILHNVISGIGQGSLLMIGFGSNDNVIQGNRFGTNPAGTAAADTAANEIGVVGVSISSSSGNLIGGVDDDPLGRCSGTCNLISGPLATGLSIRGGSNNTIEGNFVGTDVSGSQLLQLAHDGQFGIVTDVLTDSRIGGPDPHQRNLVSGHGAGEITVGGSRIFVQGNYVGTDVTGTRSLGDPARAGTGINVKGNASSDDHIVVGGTEGVSSHGCSGACNLVSGNRDGIVVVAQDSLVEGNYVGTDAGGTLALGNSGVGVTVFHQADSFGNTIGGLAAGAGNVIAFNGAHGVGIGGVGTFKAGLDCEFVPSCPGVQILSNSIHDNGCLGILLARNFIGVNPLACFGGLPNDPRDADAGPNDLQNMPLVSDIAVTPTTTTVSGSLDSRPNAHYLLQFFRNRACDQTFFYGEGDQLLETVDVTTDGSGHATYTRTYPFELGATEAISATATDVANGQTSEFAECQADVSITKTDVPDPVALGQTLTYTLHVHNAGPQPATAVVVTDDLPSSEELVAAPVPSQGTCVPPSPPALNHIECRLGDMGRNKDATVTVEVRVVDPNAVSVTNTATVDWLAMRIGVPDADPNLSNNTATAETAVAAPTGAIVVKERTLPAGDPAAFTFGGDAAGTIGDGQTITVANLAPGTYRSTQDPAPGWDLSSITCDDSDSSTDGSTATFRVAAGETVTCTFTNAKRGTIIVRARTSPAGTPGSFTFSGDAAGTIGDGGTIVRSNLSTLGSATYTSTEADPAPTFQLTDISCDDASSLRASAGAIATRNATFRLDPGETVTCTFLNSKLDEPIAAAGTDIAAVEGTAFTGTVATFHDPDPSASAAEYTASIDWGDGATSAGTISALAGGTFAVVGTHTYLEEGAAPLTVRIADTDAPANGVTVTGHAVITDAPLNAAGEGSITSPQAFAGRVAHFGDADPNRALSDYTAVVEWGDGSSSDGTIAASGTGFAVSGSHTYLATGTFVVTVRIRDLGGSTATATTTILVSGSPAVGNFVVGDLSAVVGAPVTFWGAQWWKDNLLTRGLAPAAFKGFADQPTGTPLCGGAWTTAPGNSSVPPASVPQYLTVIVASAIRQTGSVIAGDIGHVVIVKTSPGYAANPGHAGQGVVIAVVC